MIGNQKYLHGKNLYLFSLVKSCASIYKPWLVQIVIERRSL